MNEASIAVSLRQSQVACSGVPHVHTSNSQAAMIAKARELLAIAAVPRAEKKLREDITTCYPEVDT